MFYCFSLKKKTHRNFFFILFFFFCCYVKQNCFSFFIFIFVFYFVQFFVTDYVFFFFLHRNFIHFVRLKKCTSLRNLSDDKQCFKNNPKRTQIIICNFRHTPAGNCQIISINFAFMLTISLSWSQSLRAGKQNPCANFARCNHFAKSCGPQNISFRNNPVQVFP